MYDIREGQDQDVCVRTVNGTLGEGVNLRVGIQASEISKTFVCKNSYVKHRQGNSVRIRLSVFSMR